MKQDANKIHTRIKSQMDLGQWTDCISYLEKFDKKDFFDWRLFWDLGWCYYKLDKYEESIFNLKSALNICPNKDKEKALCLGFLGMSFLGGKSYTEAEDCLKQSLEIKDATITRLALAIALMRLNKTEEAESIHIEGLRLSPNNKNRLKAYADFLSDIERFDEAAELYKMVIK